MATYYLAVDIGASSGRLILGHLENGRIELEEVYRFENGMVKKNGHLCWEFDRLFREILAGMKKCREIGKVPVSMGVDTWGVDFVLLDKDDNVLGDTVGYRDHRTEGMDDEVYKIISLEELYERTGIQKAIFNTVYQLMAVKKTHPEYLEQAETLLHVPDYFHYLLTGKKTCEYTEATTGQLVKAETKDWDYELIDRLKHQNAIIPRSVFSHFVGSDSDDFDAFSAKQYELFLKGSEQLQKAFPYPILRHICNSAGIEHFPERQLEMVRLGLGLYGINPRNNKAINNVSTLRTTILQIHDVEAGESVGYSRKTVLERDSRIASLPIGYADGLDRLLGNRKGYCIVNGQKAEYVGNICMDVCMIDVTDIPCKEGDLVTIFGDELSPAELASRCGTIPYEILTGIAPRVKRIFFEAFRRSPINIDFPDAISALQ